MTEPSRTRLRLERVRRWPARRLGWAIAVAMIIMISRGHRASSGDAAHYLVIAHSAATDFDLDVSNNYGDPLLPDVAPGPHARRGPDGVLRPVHDVGLPVAAAPVFALAYRLADASRHLPAPVQRQAKLSPSLALRQLMSLAVIALTVWFARVVWRALVAGGLPEANAAVVAGLWALSPPVLSHGFLFLTELPSAALVCWLFLVRARAASCTRLALCVAGVLTGLLVLLHARNIGLVLGLAAVVLWQLRHDRLRAAVYLAGLVAGASVKPGVSLWFWGALVSPHEQVGAWSGSTIALLQETATRAIGLLIDPRHGLLWSAPVYLLLPAAWWGLRKRAPDVARDLAIVAGAYLIFVLLPVTNVHGWRGGWSPAARFLAPLAGIAVLAAPGLLGAARRWPIALVTALQIVVSLTFWLEPALFWSEGPGTAAHLRRLVGDAASQVPPVTTLSPAVLLWTGLWLAAAGAMAILLRPSGPRAPTAPAEAPAS